MELEVEKNEPAAVPDFTHNGGALRGVELESDLYPQGFGRQPAERLACFRERGNVECDDEFRGHGEGLQKKIQKKSVFC